mmetsp:Transcript_11006/g.21658  ORF Transcript_11006/g.21658 Transcript_11006/m.21658 type:complete len:342 (+) Transcript_11006:1-1026(+)
MQSEFIKRTKHWMMTYLNEAMQEKKAFYEQVSDQLSAISGTIHHAIGVRPGQDSTIQRLRDKAKLTLLRRKDSKEQKEAIDVPALIELIDQNGDNDKLDIKTLRAKLIALIITDTSARTQTVRQCTWINTSIVTINGLRTLKCIPLSTKDQHLAKDKEKRVLTITEFPFNRNVCTVDTFVKYKQRIKDWKITNDIEIATLDKDGKPIKSSTASLFLKITDPHESLSEKTVRSECKKYLQRIDKDAGPRQLRKAVPSILQFIDEASDEQTAHKFRWQREDTFKTWYKSTIPDSIKKKIKDIDKEFPDSWKLRHKFIPNKTVINKFREKYKTGSMMTDYFTKK